MLTQERVAPYELSHDVMTFFTLSNRFFTQEFLQIQER